MFLYCREYVRVLLCSDVERATSLFAASLLPPVGSAASSFPGLFQMEHHAQIACPLKNDGESSPACRCLGAVPECGLRFALVWIDRRIVTGAHLSDELIVDSFDSFAVWAVLLLWCSGRRDLLGCP